MHGITSQNNSLHKNGDFAYLLTKMWSMTNRSTSKPLYSALLSAFFNNCNKKSADFFGQRPWVVPHCLAWAQRPTPPLKLRYGTHSFLSMTFFKKRWARRSGIFLMACAASWVFCKRKPTFHITARAYFDAQMLTTILFTCQPNLSVNTLHVCRCQITAPNNNAKLSIISKSNTYFEVNTKMWSTRFAAFSCVIWFTSVFSHFGNWYLQ